MKKSSRPSQPPRPHQIIYICVCGLLFLLTWVLFFAISFSHIFASFLFVLAIITICLTLLFCAFDPCNQPGENNIIRIWKSGIIKIKCRNKQRNNLIVLTSILATLIFIPIGKAFKLKNTSYYGILAEIDVENPNLELHKTTYFKSAIGYARFEEEYARIASEKNIVVAKQLVAVYIHRLEEHQKYDVSDYLQEVTSSPRKPYIYINKNGGLALIYSPQITLTELSHRMKLFSKIIQIHPELKIIETEIKPERFKVNQSLLPQNVTSDAYYDYYQKRLQHVSKSVVLESLRSLQLTKKFSFRKDIILALVNLLKTREDPLIYTKTLDALAVWAPNNMTEINEIVSQKFSDLNHNQKSATPAFVRFLLQRTPSPALIQRALGYWEKDPNAWEKVFLRLGSSLEDSLLGYIESEDLGVRRSVIKLLKEIGREKSLIVFKEKLKNASTSDKVLLDRAIRMIKTRL